MARGSIVKRRSGNYAIVYYVDGKQKWETIGPSRREAERALTARKREVDTGTWREPSSETLASYAERWLAHRDPARVKGGRTRLSPATFDGYRRNLRVHVLPRIGHRTLSSLRTQDVDRLIAELEASGRAAGTIRNVIVPLRRMLADAVRQGLIVANPGCACRPAAGPRLHRERDSHKTHRRNSQRAARARTERPAPKRTGSPLRLFLRRRPRNRPSARGTPCTPLEGRRSRTAPDSSRASLLAAALAAAEDRRRRSVGAALPLGGLGAARGRLEGGGARPLRAERAGVWVDARHAAAAVELPTTGLGPRSDAGRARR
jgi:hypothetical protein